MANHGSNLGYRSLVLMLSPGRVLHGPDRLVKPGFGIKASAYVGPKACAMVGVVGRVGGRCGGVGGQNVLWWNG